MEMSPKIKFGMEFHHTLINSLKYTARNKYYNFGVDSAFENRNRIKTLRWIQTK